MDLLNFAFCAAATYCWLDTNDDITDESPLILKSKIQEFFYPESSNPTTLGMPIFRGFRVACAENEIFLDDESIQIRQSDLSCYGFTFFNLVDADRNSRFFRIRCDKPLQARAYSSLQPCQGGRLSKIGFQSESFIPTINEICHDEKTGSTLWAHVKIPNVIIDRQKEFTGERRFETGNYYNRIDLRGIYERNSQRNLFEKTLNAKNIADKYFPFTGL